MASEPLFEEQSDAVKVSETPYPTKGSGKNLAKNTGVKYTFCDYPLPDSSLSLITLWFRSAHSHACRRSRMMARVSELRLNTCLSFLNEVKNLAKDTGVKYVFYRIFVFLLLFHVKRKGIILTEKGILCILM